MNKVIIIFISFTFSLYFYGQTNSDSLWKIKENSIFQDTNSGVYNGNSDGKIDVVYDSIKRLTLDFEKSHLELKIKRDAYEVYDNSTKKYSTKTTSGKPLLTYEIYALANILTISFNNEHYSIGKIDGACEYPITGLSFSYSNTKEIEYLTLVAIKDLTLTTTPHIMKSKGIDYPEAKKIAKTLIIKKGSKITLTIEK